MASPTKAQSVFLNVPYMDTHDPILLAIVVTIIAVGRSPRIAAEIPGSDSRIEKILKLIKSCAVSIHDLTPQEGNPRFNMAMELGVALQLRYADRKSHEFFIFETVNHRLAVTLSDMAGYDPEIHHGTEDGAIRAVMNVLPVVELSPSFTRIKAFLDNAKPAVASLIESEGTTTILNPDTWQKTIALITLLAEQEGFDLQGPIA